MEFKGTKGPWHLEDGGRGSWVCNSGGEYAAISAGITDEVAEANGYLIAAAPDLLKACMDFIEKVDSGRARSVKTYGQMKAAVEKALGK